MPWYTPWSDHIAKRVCKYLLQRYLGQFLEEKLTLDQLTVDLYKGIGTIKDVALDMLALNEVAEAQSLPFLFVDGFIEEMSVAIPWSSLLSDSSDIQVRGLTLTIKYKERDKSRASMFESMWSSMSSSMQLAEDCLRSEKEMAAEDGTNGSFEGIERFAQTIDSILSRIRVRFSKTVLRLEEVIPNTMTGVALEFVIQNMEYWDAAGERPVDADNTPELVLPIFSTKRLVLEGVAIYTDQFLANKLERDTQTLESESMGDDIPVLDNTVLIGKLAGRQDISMQFKHDSLGGPKVDLSLRLGALTLFTSPRQVHEIMYLVQSMSGANEPSAGTKKSRFTEKKMGESDFRKIEQELLTELNQTNMPQSQCLENRGWGSNSMEDSADFLPVGHVSRYNESVASSTCSLASSISSVGSGRSSRSSLSQASYVDSRSTQPGIGVPDTDPSLATFHFHVSLSSVALVLLHDDVLACSLSSPDGLATPASLQAMHRLAEDFFASLGHFSVSGFGNKDFHEAKHVFLNACQRNHLRFLAAPVIIEGSETANGRGSMVKGSLSMASAQLVECLVEMGSANQSTNVEYIELITFIRSKEENGTPQFEALPSVKFDFSLHQGTSRRDKGRKLTQPRYNFSMELQSVEVELDLTLIDRISSLLQVDPLPTSAIPAEFKDRPNVSHLRQAMDNTITASARHYFKITSPFVLFKIRFPVPDMRPLHDMDRLPWWRRHVRSDLLVLDVTDLSLNTALDPMDPVLKFEIQYRHLIAKFQEGGVDVPVPFVSVGTDPACNTILDGGRGFGWPRLVLSFHPENQNVDLEVVETNTLGQSMGHVSLIAALERTQQRELSPFSFQRVIHGHEEGDGEELVTPASKHDLAQFQEVAASDARIKLDVFCPTASVLLPSKRLYELIYNRLTMDLMMWKSSAPVRDVAANANVSVGTSRLDDVPLRPSFNLCKSAIHYDSDSDEESEGGLFFSVAEHKKRHRDKKVLENGRPRQQSKMAVTLSVGQGLCDLYVPVRDGQGNIIPEQSGELLISADEVTYMYVTGFSDKKDLDYMCVQANSVALYHCGLLTDVGNAPVLRSAAGVSVPHYLLPTIYRMDAMQCPDSGEPVGVGSAQSLDMLTAAVKIDRDENNRSLKYFRVALGLRNVGLRYRVCEARNSWFNQLIDLFDVNDYPIAGYEPSTVVTELNLHLWNCNIDYRPLYLPLRSILNVGSFNISSNIAAKTNSSTLRVVAEDASFFLTDKMGSRPQASHVHLQRDYVCVMQLGLFELFLRLCELPLNNPKVDLRASANALLVRTCSDSAKALLELITYFAADGDLHGWEADLETPPPASINIGEEQEVLVSTEDAPQHVLSKSQVARVHDLMQEAMQESQGSKAYFSLDKGKDNEEEENEEQECVVEYGVPLLGSELTSASDFDDGWEDEFCILENEAGIGILPKSGLPEVRQLTPEPPRLVDNHFSLPTGRADHLRSPKHYPRPVVRYTLTELSLLWQMYGGSDFETPPPPKQVSIQTITSDDQGEKLSGNSAIAFSKSSPGSVRFESLAPASHESKLTWRERGGVGRKHDVLMELQLTKVQFQHELYPEYTEEASRQVLLVKDLELRDRLATSHINKFLYQYYTEAKPKQAHANMVVIKTLQMRADPKVNAQECCLKVSLLPLRLNIDQDALLFLVQFFTELSGEPKEEAMEEEPPLRAGSRNETPTHAPPVMSVTTKGKPDEAPLPLAPPLIQLEEPRLTPRARNRPRRVSAPNKPPAPPIYFKCVLFSPEVPVRLDYQGKHVDLSHGPLQGILMGLGQLSNSELRLKRIAHRHGLLGFDKLCQFILNEWTNDLKRNQLPGLLGGVGPIHALVQLFQGIRDLFWLPIEQYQRDGRLVRGIQRGANSFTTSSAMAVLELTSRLIQIIQSTAETAYDMVSPGPSVRSKRTKKDKRKHYTQPVDIREGVANAISVVKHGIGETATNLVRVASEEHEQKGITGAVGGVLRQIPPTVVTPILLATEATSNVIGGVRSQLIPDARKDAVDKWRGQTS